MLFGKRIHKSKFQNSKFFRITYVTRSFVKLSRNYLAIRNCDGVLWDLIVPESKNSCHLPLGKSDGFTQMGSFFRKHLNYYTPLIKFH